ncbi:MAG: cobamide remodeling phosphodiesterase CbiR [Methanolobus sp.]|nr:cobamide remodeling phosphodiesterase CbiR [Methanolobus sp.]
MKFGINVFQSGARYGYLEGTEKPIGIASYLSSIESIRKLGFTHYEVLLDPLMKALNREERCILFAKLAEFNKNHDMTSSIHMPFWWIDISVPDSAMRNTSVEQIISLTKDTQVMDPTHYVVHALQPVTPGRIAKVRLGQDLKAMFMQEYYETVKESLHAIATNVEDSKKIAIENLQQESDYTQLWKLAEELDLSINYDYGHQFLAEQNVYNGFDKMWPRISSIHAHNIYIEKTGHKEACVLKDHKGLANGIINTKEILDYLKNRHYEGLFVVEVMTTEDARNSSDFLKKHGFIL